jgi:hypothetical protein
MTRYIIFAIAILLGLAGGLYYGWVVNPVQGGASAPELLREDFRADYVLMVAEIYHSEQNPEHAAQHLALLGPDNPLVSVNAALEFARSQPFGKADRDLLEELDAALRAWDPALVLTLTPDG